ncbi:MAG: hypothetical protein KAF91_30195 [Nostoc sp. TH1S01]|nr:hypothetical protein [Nostoc sp. TH1S01]
MFQQQQLHHIFLITSQFHTPRAKAIATKDGFTYRYDKNPTVLKLMRV